MGLDTVELVMTVEEEFGVAIPNDAARTLARLGDIHGLVVRLLQGRGESVDPAEVWERLKEIVRRQCGIPEKDIVPGAHLVYDLGLD